MFGLILSNTLKDARKENIGYIIIQQRVNPLSQ